MPWRHKQSKRGGGGAGECDGNEVNVEFGYESLSLSACLPACVCVCVCVYIYWNSPSVFNFFLVCCVIVYSLCISRRSATGHKYKAIPF